MEENEFLDITETGTGGLEGLPPVNLQNSNSFDDIQNFLNMQKQKERNYSYSLLMQQSLPLIADIPVGIAAMEAGVGDSRYDNQITNLQLIQDLDEFRARRQSGAALIANGIGKAATTFGTTYLSSTIGGLVGLFQGIGNTLDNDEKTTFFNGVWNNMFNQEMSNVQDKMEQILPNYYTQEEQLSPWYTNIFTPNFLGDKLIKNSGFMGGSAAAMLTFGKLGSAFKVTDFLSKLGKGGNVMNWLITNFLGSNGEASIEAINSVKQNEKALEFNIKNFENQRKQEIDEKYQFDLMRGVDPDIALLERDNALSALNIELQAYNDVRKDELTSAGNAVYGMNVVALMLTNGINMGSFIKGGYKNASHIWNNAVFKVGEKTGGIKDFTTKELSKAFVEGNLKADAKEIERGALKTVGRWALNSAAEGIQEGIQSEISTATEILTQSRLNKYAKDNNLTDAYMNPATTDEYITLSTAALEAWDQQFGSINAPGWEEVFIGALSAAIGLPNAKIQTDVRKDNTLQKRFKLGWQGGIAEAIEDVYGDKRKLQTMSEVLNEKLQDPNLIEIIRKAIGSLSIEDAKDQAIENLDIRRYKNLEIALATSNALFFKDHGLLDAYLGAFEEFAKGISDENLDQIIMSTYSLEKGESLLQDLKREDIRRMYQDKARSTVEKINNIVENDRYLREKFTDKFDENHSLEALTELVYRKSLYDDTLRRKEELEQQLQDIEDKDDQVSKIQKSYLRKSINQLEKQAEQLDEFIKHAFDDPEAYQEEIDKVRDERMKYAISRDGASARLAYSQAKDLNDIAEIYYRGDINTRDEILNQAIDEILDKSSKALLKEFLGFKEDVDVIYELVDNIYALMGTTPSVNRMRDSVKEELDGIVIDSLNDERYLLDTVSDRIGQLIERIDNIINDKENGPYLYDEYGRFLEVKDMDLLMFLEYTKDVYKQIKDKLDDVQGARETGEKSPKSVRNEDLSNASEVSEEGSLDFGNETSEEPVEEIIEIPVEEILKSTEEEPEIEEQGEGLPILEQPEQKEEIPESNPEKTEPENQEQKQPEQESEILVQQNTNPIKEELIVELSELGDSGIPVTIDETLTVDNNSLTDSRTSLKGNNYAPYTINGLKEGKLIVTPDRKGVVAQTDKVKIQRFLDKHMSEWMRRTKDSNQKIHFITHQEHPEIIYLAVKKNQYTDFIDNFNELFVLSANDEFNTYSDYIIIGTLGFYQTYEKGKPVSSPVTKALLESFNRIKNGLVDERTKDGEDLFDGYHVSKYTTSIKKFVDGYKIHDPANKVSLNELLNGSQSQFTNPFGLDDETLKISYITGDEVNGYSENFIRMNQSDSRYRPNIDAMQPGRVFIYVPTNNGRLMPMFVETMRFNEWFDDNRDTELAKKIDSLLKRLSESHPEDETRSATLRELYDTLVFSGDQHLIFAKNGTVVQSSGINKRIVYTRFALEFGEIVFDKMDLIDDAAQNSKYNLLMDAIREINPRIALNKNTLSNNIQYYIESNVLQTDFLILGTVGANIYVNPLDENMNVVEEYQDNGFQDQTTSRQRQNNFVAVYVPNANSATTQYWYDPYDNVLQDANKNIIDYVGNENLYIIADIVYKEMNNMITPSYNIDGVDYFQVGNDVVRKNVRSYEVLSEQDKLDYFNTRDKLIEAERKRKEREEAEKLAQLKPQDIHDVEDENPMVDEKKDEEKVDTPEKIDKLVSEFIENVVTLQLENQDDYWRMMDVRSDLCDDETEIYKYASQLVGDLDDLNAVDAFRAFLKEIYKKQSFKGNYAAFRQAVLHLNDETVLNDIKNCK